jgi:hypothetical protein
MFFVTGTGSSGCSGEPMDGFSASASLTLPANGVIALVRV